MSQVEIAMRVIESAQAMKPTPKEGTPEHDAYARALAVVSAFLPEEPKSLTLATTTDAA